MLALDATQRAIVASTYKKVSWLFKVIDSAGPTTYYWSTIARSYGGNSYTYKIIPASFAGVDLNRARSEMGMQTPNTLAFVINNAGNTLSADDFVGGSVTLYLVISDGTNEETIRTWKFDIKQCEPAQQKLSFACEDFLQKYLEGDWPNTKLVKDILPSTDPDQNDNVCVPVVFGKGYPLLRSLFIDDARYYVLGPASGKTYGVYKVRMPRSQGQTEWSAENCSFTQSTKTINGVGWRVFQPMIADSDGDTIPDACGVFKDGTRILDMPAQVSCSDTINIINVADVIEYILKDFGIPAAEIGTGAGSSFEKAAAQFKSRQIAFEGSYFYKQPRATILAALLVMCHSTFDITDKIELRPLTSAPQMATFSTLTLYPADDLYPGNTQYPYVVAGGDYNAMLAVIKTTGMHIKKDKYSGETTFKYNSVRPQISDSGYIAFQTLQEPEDELIKALVPAKSTTDNISGNIIEFPLLRVPGNAVKAGILYYQRNFLKKASISYAAKGLMIALCPDDMIPINHADYGGSYDVLIDSMKIRHSEKPSEFDIEFICTRFSATLDDWDDLWPGGVNIATDTTTISWRPTLTDPAGQIVGLPVDLFQKGSDTIDVIRDGTTYARILAAALQAGLVLLSQTVGSVDDIADGTIYAKLLAAGLLSGKLIAAGIDGANFGDLIISSGTLTLADYVQIGASGTPVAQHLSATITWDPGSLTDGASETKDITVTGAILGDIVAVGLSTVTNAGWQISGQVTAADTVTVTLTNHTGGTVDLGSGTLRVAVWQY